MYNENQFNCQKQVEFVESSFEIGSAASATGEHL